ncbi:MAG: ADP-ribosylglycohydrolase family protein, partial [Anaerolineae bacterium]
MTTLPPDYEKRVYAGVLGKIIGVYLGRPFEGWSYERIMDVLGEINYYVHERLDKPLIVTDDDISGTFTFVRALADYDNNPRITPAQIGQTWLNYIIEERAILWWGGMGNSTEHTAFLRLKSGIEAPRSGSMELNGQVVAEQIGAQIFIDGWAMVAPGDPARAADLARRAASVSHDGEAIYGAQVWAAMEALAFVESDLDVLLDTGVSFISEDSTIYRVIAELRNLRTRVDDWREARQWLDDNYGYHKYGGGVHMVPNHGLMILSLLYGDDDFQKTMMIVNTSGWDTDCNSGNVGCLMGIKNGLRGLATGPDYRGPVADRLYLPTADGGRAVTDAVTETYHLVNSGRALAGLKPVHPQNGARFHFSFPGAVQGFMADDSVDSAGTLSLENVLRHSARSLALHYTGVATGRVARAGTATFLTPEAARMPGYGLISSPTLYSGQTVRARVEADAEDKSAVNCGLYIKRYGVDDALITVSGPQLVLEPGTSEELSWRIPSSPGEPIAEVGLEIRSDRRADGTIYLDTLTWDGAPDAKLGPPPHTGSMWQRAWVDAVDHLWARDGLRLSQDRGTGMLVQGTREWKDYEVEASYRPHLIRRGGLAARVQGLKRYYALLLCREDKVRVVKSLDGETVLAETDFVWTYDRAYQLRLRVEGNQIDAWIDDQHLFEVTDENDPLN